MDGILLSKEEKVQIREALFDCEVPCRYYSGAALDYKIWAKIFSKHTNRNDIFTKAVIEDIELWMSMFPKGHNVPNASAYAAQLYELLCEDNCLTHLGVKMILDKTLKSYKQVPSIFEIVSELQPIKEKHSEFDKSHKEFMRLYQETEKKFIQRIDDIVLNDVLDIKQLLKAWHTLFIYDAFPGCDVRMHPFKPDSSADLVINALSKPYHENPLLMVFLAITEIGTKENIDQYNASVIYEEMANLYPDVPIMRGDPKVFYLPDQWKNLDLGRVKPEVEHETSLFNYDELIPDLITTGKKQTEIMTYIRKVTYGTFSCEGASQ